MTLHGFWVHVLLLWWWFVLNQFVCGFQTYITNTYAGTGTGGYSSDNVQATASKLYSPYDVCDDATGNVYISDQSNHRIRKVIAVSNTIVTFAGSGVSGFGGDGSSSFSTSARINNPLGLWMSSINVLYFCDGGNHRIRKVVLTTLSTVAGNGSRGYGSGDENQPATSVSLYWPYAVRGDTLGAVYVSDSSNNRIRKILPSGLILTIAGGGSGAVPGTATSTALNFPRGLWVTSDGRIYFADCNSHRILYYTSDNILALAGLDSNVLRFPTGVLVTSTDNTLYIADNMNYVIRAYDLATDQQQIIAGTGDSAQSTVESNPSLSVPFSFPLNVYGRSSSKLYVVDGTANKVKVLTPPVPSYQPTGQPTRQPSRQPTSQPTRQPQVCPSSKPSRQPTSQPTSQPQARPTSQPTAQPTSRPSRQPTSQPTGQPQSRPTSQPSRQPTTQPQARPTGQPTAQPTSRPSRQPTSQPTGQPRAWPTSQPSRQPTSRPSRQPTSQPTGQPRARPTSQPTSQPTTQPQARPTGQPTAQPTSRPSRQPTSQPTAQPQARPSSQPTSRPSRQPTSQPTSQPQSRPTSQPTAQPMSCPSRHPSSQPTGQPQAQPTGQPSKQPTSRPSRRPTGQPQARPTSQPSTQPTSHPSRQPASQPTGQPQARPTSQPTAKPTDQPQARPSSQPTKQTTRRPTNRPSRHPTSLPSGHPQSRPTSQPSGAPSNHPSLQPQSSPSCHPTSQPTSEPRSRPTSQPSRQPTSSPSGLPTAQPSCQLQARPSYQPASDPICHPSVQPISQPSEQPTSRHSRQPACQSTDQPQSSPSAEPISLPTSAAQSMPSSQPTSMPTQSPPTVAPSSLPTAETAIHPPSRPSNRLQPSSQPSTALSTPEMVGMSRWPSLWPSDAPTRNFNSSSASPSEYPSSGLRSSQPSNAGGSTGPTLVLVISPTAPTANPSLTQAPTVFATESNMSHCAMPRIRSPVLLFDDSISVRFETDITVAAVSQASFVCDQMLAFRCASKSLCRWKNQKSIIVQLPSPADDCVASNDSIGIDSQFVSMWCSQFSGSSSQGNNCSECANNALNTTVPLNIPFSFRPHLIVDAPSQWSACSDYVLDLSQSFGFGKRKWQDVSILVDSANVTDSQRLGSYIKNQLMVHSVVVIPHWMLTENGAYDISIRACNFLAKCDSTVHKLAMNVAESPVVSLSGSPRRQMRRSEQLTVNARIDRPACVHGIEIVSHRWEILSANGTLWPFHSSSSSLIMLVLPPFSFPFLGNFTIQFRVTSKSTNISMSATVASVTVSVVEGRIVPLVMGGTVRMLSAGGFLPLDFQHSYDEDTRNSSMVASPLRVTFSRAVCLPAVLSSCQQYIAVTRMSSLQLRISAAQTAPLAPVVMAMVFNVSNGRKTSMLELSLTVLPVGYPVLAMSVHQQLALNVKDVVRVEASCFTQSAGDVNATVASVAFVTRLQTTILSATSSSTDASSTVLFSAYLRGSMLLSGIDYTLTLSCRDAVSHRVSSSSLLVAVRQAPAAGAIVAFPSVGYELNTDFVVSAVNWVDVDLPISYAFSFISTSTSLLSLSSFSVFSHVRTQLPAGDSRKNFSLGLMVDVVDANSAQSTLSSSVQVFPSQQLSLSAISELLSSPFASSLASTPAQLNVAIGALNSLDCSRAPNCTSLHRRACSRIPNTCGSCSSINLIGDQGDANTECVFVSNSSPHVIANVTKSCARNCSQNGLCRFRSIVTAAVVGVCLVGQLDCVSECSCATGYFGSDCSLNKQEMASRRSMREEIANQMMLKAANQESGLLTDRISSISELLLRYDEVSLACLDTVSDLTPPSSLALDVIDSLIQSFVYNQLVLAAPQANTSTLSSPSSRVVSNKIRALLEQVLDSIGSALPSEQPAVDQVLQTYSFYVRACLVDSGQQQFVLPQSAQLSALAIPPTIVSISQTSQPITGYMGFYHIPNSVVNASGHFNDAQIFDSVIMRAQLQSPLLCAPASCKSRVEFPFFLASQSPSSLASTVTSQTVVCGDRSVQVPIECPGYPPFLVECNGTAMIVSVVCPKTHHQPSCDSVFAEGGGSTTEHCLVTNVSDSRVACTCPLFASQRRRQLSSVNATTMSISIVGLMSATTTSFVSTVLRSQSLNASMIRRSWVVVATLVAFVGLSVSVGFLSRIMDRTQSEKISVDCSDQKSAKVHLSDADYSMDAFLQLAEDALPLPATAGSTVDRLTDAVKHHHRWFAVAFHYSPKLPRLLRVLSLTTNVVIMLFVQSLTYALSAGDDGSCGQNVSESSCLAEPSGFQTGQSNCRWNRSVEKCEYVQPSNSLMIVLFVALLSTLITTPLAVFNEWLIFDVLGADEESPQASAAGAGMSPQTVACQAVVPAPIPVATGRGANGGLTSKMAAAQLDLRVLSEYTAFLSQLIEYRRQLGPQEVKEFNVVWGINDDGEFVESIVNNLAMMLLYWKTSGSVEDRIKTEIRESIVQSDDEQSRFELQNVNDEERSRRILFHFQKDLMVGLSEFVLECQDKREKRLANFRTRGLKRLCAAALAIENALMLFYVLLFGIVQDSHHQNAWAQSFAIWLLMEVVFFATMLVLVYNVLLPMVLMKDLPLVRNKIISTMRRHIGPREHVVNATAGPVDEMQSSPFNAAKYLHTSYRLASLNRQSAISRLLMQYSTPWPRQSYVHNKDKESESYDSRFDALTSSVIQLLSFLMASFLVSPVQLQNMLVSLIGTTVIGFILSIHVRLYYISPPLVIVPSAGLLLVVLAYELLVHQRCSAAKNVTPFVVKPPVHSLTPSALGERSPTASQPPPDRRQSLQSGVELLLHAQHRLEEIQSPVDGGIAFAQGQDAHQFIDEEAAVSPDVSSEESSYSDRSQSSSDSNSEYSSESVDFAFL